MSTGDVHESSKLLKDKLEGKAASRESAQNASKPESDGRDDSASSSQPSAGFPLSVYTIIATEFCERFNYYGMRTVLIIYLSGSLLYDSSSATAIYHGFATLTYFTPILGGFVADTFLGRFKTILILSLIYASGSIGLAATSFHSLELNIKRVGAFVGLSLIAFGTGGIKPCVSAFGADQIAPDQSAVIARFFAAFYFSINAGSTLSTIISPILYSEVNCDGGECYPLAFGVPATLMLLAVLLFVSASRSYKKFPPNGSFFGDFFCCICSAISGYFRHLCGKRPNGDGNQPTSDLLKNDSLSCSSEDRNFLDYAAEKYSAGFIRQVRGILRVLLVLTPVPVFWALFDQQGSTWTLQAMAMDGNLFGWCYVQPNQVQVINPILIIILIPLFETFIYPVFTRCNFLTSKQPLQRMVFGGLFASAAFVATAFIQSSVDATLPTRPEAGSFVVSVVNAVPQSGCSLSVTGDFGESRGCQISVANLTYLQQSSAMQFSSQCVSPSLASLPLTLHLQCPQVTKTFSTSTPITQQFARPNQVYTIYLGMPSDGRISANLVTNDVEKSEVGRSSVRFVSAISLPDDAEMEVIGFAPGIYAPIVWSFRSNQPLETTDYVEVDRATYSFVLLANGVRWREIASPLDTRNGASWSVVLHEQAANDSISQHTVADMPPNSISVFWQVPQYVLISIAEILFSISGLNFAYDQAPPAARSMMIGFWMLTSSFGNLLVVIVAELRFASAVAQLLFFAALMLADLFLFAVLAYFYVYVDYTDQALELAEKFDPTIDNCQPASPSAKLDVNS